MDIFGRVRSTYRRNGGAPTCCTVIPANSKFTVSCFYFAFAEFNEFIDLMPYKGQAGKSISVIMVMKNSVTFAIFEFAVFFEYMYTMFYNLLGITVHGSIYLHRGMNKLNKHY